MAYGIEQYPQLLGINRAALKMFRLDQKGGPIFSSFSKGMKQEL